MWNYLSFVLPHLADIVAAGHISVLVLQVDYRDAMIPEESGNLAKSLLNCLLLRLVLNSEWLVIL